MTPLEFVPQMEHLFPDCNSELVNITNAYLKVRYGELPETQHEVQAVLIAWNKVKKTGNQVRKSTESYK